MDGETQPIHLSDVGLFKNFEVARECFIENYLKKIENGCKPVRSNKLCSARLRDAIDESKNSMFGYWLRVRDHEDGCYETFLRKKRWLPCSGERRVSPITIKM